MRGRPKHKATILQLQISPFSCCHPLAKVVVIMASAWITNFFISVHPLLEAKWLRRSWVKERCSDINEFSAMPVEQQENDDPPECKYALNQLKCAVGVEVALCISSLMETRCCQQVQRASVVCLLHVVQHRSGFSVCVTWLPSPLRTCTRLGHALDRPCVLARVGLPVPLG